MAGDAGAFGLLFERHARAVYNLCFRRTGNWAVAEDLTSEVFLLAWRRRREVVFTTEGGSVLPWLLGVAVNLARNRHRSDRRAVAAVARLDAGASEADFSDDLVGRLADERQMADVLTVRAAARPGAGGARALRLVRPELRGLRARARRAGRDGAFATSRARAHLRELLDAGGHELLESP